MGDEVFEKHVIGRKQKIKLVAVEDFDPRPLKYRGSGSHWPHLRKLINFLRLLPHARVIRTYSWPQSLMGLRK